MRTNENTIEQWERMALASAWRVAGGMADGGGDILDVAGEVARMIEPEEDPIHVDNKYGIRDAIVDALATFSEVKHGEAGDRCGITRIAGERVWWIETNAYSNWHQDEPDWWGEQVAQYATA